MLRLTRREVLSEGGAGPIRSVLDAHGSALALFGKDGKGRECNEIIRQAFEVGGWTWIWKWLPLRFTKYAFTLNYHCTPKYWGLKQKIGGDKALPNVWSTDSRSNAANARAEGIATSKKQEVKIFVPKIAPPVRKYILTVPPNEIKAVAKAIESALVETLSEHVENRMAPGGSATQNIENRRAIVAARQHPKQGPERRRAQ